MSITLLRPQSCHIDLGRAFPVLGGIGLHGDLTGFIYKGAYLMVPDWNSSMYPIFSNYSLSSGNINTLTILTDKWEIEREKPESNCSARLVGPGPSNFTSQDQFFAFAEASVIYALDNQRYTDHGIMFITPRIQYYFGSVPAPNGVATVDSNNILWGILKTDNVAPINVNPIHFPADITTPIRTIINTASVSHTHAPITHWYTTISWTYNSVQIGRVERRTLPDLYVNGHWYQFDTVSNGLLVLCDCSWEDDNGDTWTTVEDIIPRYFNKEAVIETNIMCPSLWSDE